MLERPARDKHCGLLGKKNTLWQYKPGVNVIKLFLPVIYKLRQAFRDYSNKQSSLVQKFVNYGHKSFIILAPVYASH
jgi:hypothetical protein